MQPITYNPAGCFVEQHGITPEQLADLGPQLEAARDEVLADTDLYAAGDAPKEKTPLDAAFFELPSRLLDEYERDRDASELGGLLNAAARIREAADRVVVLGIGGSYMGARALMEACCHPFHNELSRAERGGRPRMYFEGNNLDNDASQGLLDMLAQGDFQTVDGRWAIVVISKSGGTLETAVALRQFISALRASAGKDADISPWVVPVTGESGKLFELSEALGCRERFRVPDGVGGRFSILSAVGLLPAAVLGLDVVALLRGAVAMNETFRAAPADANPVLQYVGVCHLLERTRGASIRVLSVWSKALESIGLWYDQLLAESLGKQERGATPLTTLNTRDLHSRAQQHQEGARDKLITNLTVANWRTDPLPVGKSDDDQDNLNRFADKTLPELLTAALEGVNQAYREDGRPTAGITLPGADEASLGQLLQMLMLATVVEGRLIGVNPYGQPGVEGYKRNMQAILERGLGEGPR